MTKSGYAEMYFQYGELQRLIIVCLLLLSICDGGIMKKSVRDILLALHNNARQAVRNGQLEGQPQAVSLMPLKWNDELEWKAQRLSDQCRVGHDNASDRKIPQFEYVGQNWAGASKVEIGFKLWLDEYKNYDFKNLKCRVGDCGHYTQIVWERTTDVGCGVTDCPNFPYGLSIVCNYGPGGNYIGEPPYSIAKHNTDSRFEKEIESDDYNNYKSYSRYSNYDQEYF